MGERVVLKCFNCESLEHRYILNSKSYIFSNSLPVCAIVPSLAKTRTPAATVVRRATTPRSAQNLVVLMRRLSVAVVTASVTLPATVLTSSLSRASTVARRVIVRLIALMRRSSSAATAMNLGLCLLYSFRCVG